MSEEGKKGTGQLGGEKISVDSLGMCGDAETTMESEGKTDS